MLVSCGEQKSNENNPFMSDYENEYGIPPFDKITYADYEPAVDAGIEEQNAEIDSIIKNPAEPNFENTILALDNSGRILDKVSRVFNALSSSDNTPEMQKLRTRVKPGMLPPFYYEKKTPVGLDEIQASERRYIEAYLKNPFMTDWRYFWGTLANILFRRKSSK
jgi:hypothetical protein